MQNNRPKRPDRPDIMATQRHLDFGFPHPAILADQPDLEAAAARLAAAHDLAEEFW